MADIEISKIILRRGAAFDLPGKPTKLFPRQWTTALDEGEVAFASDQGRLFIGADPAHGMRQSQRLQYPYRNVEVIGENSVDAFADKHGERMREGDEHDYYSGPIYPTAKAASAQTPDRFVAEDSTGYARYGVEQNPPSITGAGDPAVRSIQSSTATLAINGSGSLSSPVRYVEINDFARNRLVTLAHSSDGATITTGTTFVHTVEIRDSYGTIVASYAVGDIGDDHRALFTPSVYLSNNMLAGVIATEQMDGLGIYDEVGNPVNLPIVVYGDYVPLELSTRITDTVSIPGQVPVPLGPITYNGTTYYCFGDGNVTVGTVGDYVMASCASHIGDSSDPASFLIFGNDGSYKGKIAMPAAYDGATVYKWIKAGTRTIACVRPNGNLNQTHFLVFTPGSSTVNMQIVNGYDAAVAPIASHGSPLIDYLGYVANDDTLLVFSHIATTVMGTAGNYYCAAKLSLADYSVVWSNVSIFVPTALPQISDGLWRSPPSSAITFADRILGYTFKWVSDVGYHDINLATGAIRSAAWSESTVSKPANIAFSGSPSFYDEAQDRIIFGGGSIADTSQYTFQNNSTAATGNAVVAFYAPNFVQGGDEFTSKLCEVLSPNGQRSFLINVCDNRWVAVYNGGDLTFIDGWDGGGTITLGGSVIPATNGHAFMPITDGSMLRLTVNDAGSIYFTIVPCVDVTDNSFGVNGMYFHDSSDNSIVVIGGPENNTTTARSFKWMIDTNTIKWSRAYSGPFAPGELDDEQGCPTLPPIASQIVAGGFFGWINSFGGVSLIDLATGSRLYKGMAETTTGFDSTTPWGFSQWSWESATNTLIYVNTTSQFANADTNTSNADAVAHYTGAEAYLSGTINQGVDLIKIRFKRNSSGIWSTEVTRPDAQTDRFPPDMRLWADYTHRFVYCVSNGYLKCYDLDTLALVATTQSSVGGTFMKLWGSTVTGRLYYQYGTHDAGVSGADGISYVNSSLYDNRLNSVKSYEPLQCVNLFGKHRTVGVTWRDLYVNGDTTVPYEIHNIASVNAFVDYTVNNQDGHRIRYGQHQLHYFYNPLTLPGEVGSDASPTMVDEAEQLVRVVEQDPQFNPEYDPSASVGQIAFRYVLVDEDVPEPVLRLQYRNYSTETLSIQWKLSRPTLPTPIRGPRGFADLLPLNIAAMIAGHHELVVFIDYQAENIDLWNPAPPYTRFVVSDPMAFFDYATYSDVATDYVRMYLYSTAGATQQTAQAQIDNQTASYNAQQDAQIKSMINTFAGLAGFSSTSNSNYQDFIAALATKGHADLVQTVVGVFLYFITKQMYSNLASTMRPVDRIMQQVEGAAPHTTGIQSLSKIQTQTRTIVANSDAATGGTESSIRGAVASFAQLGTTASPNGFAPSFPLFNVPTAAQSFWLTQSNNMGLVAYYLNNSASGSLVETTDRTNQLNVNIFAGYGAVPFSVGEGHILTTNGTHAWSHAVEIAACSTIAWPASMEVSLYRPSDYALIRSFTMDNSCTQMLDTDGVTILGYLNVMREIETTVNPTGTVNPYNGNYKLLAESGTNNYIMAIRVPDGTVHARPEKPFDGWYWKIVMRIARDDVTPGIGKYVGSGTADIHGANQTLVNWDQTGEWEWTAYAYEDHADGFSAHMTIQMPDNFFDGIHLLHSPDAPDFDFNRPRPNVYVTTQYWTGRPVDVSNPTWCVGRLYPYDYDYILTKG